MSLLILLFIIPFVFIAFLSNQPQEATLNPLFRYLSFESHILLMHLWLFVLFTLVISLLAVFLLTFDAPYPFLKKWYFTFAQTFLSAIVAFFLAFFILCFIAILQLNSFSLLQRFAPSALGVTTDIKTIAKILQNDKQMPEIIVSDTNQQKELAAYATATTGNNNFYGQYLLPSMPSFLVFPLAKATSSVQLLDNTLIISAMKPEDIQTISPVLGYILVKEYFQNRYIKAYPEVSSMDRQEYLAGRDEDANQKIHEIDLQIQSITDFISSLSATIKQDKDRIGLSPLTVATASAAKQNDTPTQKLQSDQKLLANYLHYEIIYKQQRQAVQVSKLNFPHELGVFAAPKSIRVALDTDSSHRLADYLETLTHEYYHYASYVSPQKHFSDLFFEEGLTEYFARQTIDNDLHIQTNLGYPVFAKIISEMTKSIPESDLADIYFSKDEAGLEKTLDRVYGDGFYANNKLLFTSLQYTSDPQQMIKIANEIMKQIGGNPLTIRDVISTFSSL